MVMATSIFQLEQAILAAALAGIDHTGSLSIARNCIVPGEIVWDACQCGQLVLAESRRYPSKSFPAEDASDDDNGCQPWLVLDITISLVRCVPVIDEAGNPPACTDLQHAAQQLEKDMTDLRKAAECYLHTQYDSHAVAAFQLGAQTVVGPQGACAGHELALLVG